MDASHDDEQDTGPTLQGKVVGNAENLQVWEYVQEREMEWWLMKQ